MPPEIVEAITRLIYLVAGVVLGGVTEYYWHWATRALMWLDRRGN